MIITLKKLAMIVFIVSSGLFQSVLANESVERIFWDKKPLRITLPVGQERIVSFPSAIRIGLSASLEKKLRTQINNNTIYWLAHDEFTSQRIEIRAIDGSVIYLVDLIAKKSGASVEPIEVILKNAQPPALNVQQDRKIRRNPELATGTRRTAPGYIHLSRFAAQQLYAPTRLLQQGSSIHRVPVNRQATSYLMQGAKVLAKPVAAWKQGSLYITALEIKNLSGDPIALDPRKIRGQWKAATFQYTYLHPAGSEHDSSVLYLISDRPFHEVL